MYICISPGRSVGRRSVAKKEREWQVSNCSKYRYICVCTNCSKYRYMCICTNVFLHFKSVALRSIYKDMFGYIGICLCETAWQAPVWGGLVTYSVICACASVRAVFLCVWQPLPGRSVGTRQSVATRGKEKKVSNCSRRNWACCTAVARARGAGTQHRQSRGWSPPRTYNLARVNPPISIYKYSKGGSVVLP